MRHMNTGGVIPTFDLKDRARKAREFAGLEQEELASRTGMARSTIARIEQGRNRPRKPSILAIAVATGVNYEWLATGKTPIGGNSGGDDVRHQGLEPRTHWLRSSKVSISKNVA